MNPVNARRRVRASSGLPPLLPSPKTQGLGTTQGGQSGGAVQRPYKTATATPSLFDQNKLTGVPKPPLANRRRRGAAAAQPASAGFTAGGILSRPPGNNGFDNSGKPVNNGGNGLGDGKGYNWGVQPGAIPPIGTGTPPPVAQTPYQNYLGFFNGNADEAYRAAVNAGYTPTASDLTGGAIGNATQGQQYAGANGNHYVFQNGNWVLVNRYQQQLMKHGQSGPGLDIQWADPRLAGPQGTGGGYNLPSYATMEQGAQAGAGLAGPRNAFANNPGAGANIDWATAPPGLTPPASEGQYGGTNPAYPMPGAPPQAPPPQAAPQQQPAAPAQPQYPQAQQAPQPHQQQQPQPQQPQQGMGLNGGQNQGNLGGGGGGQNGGPPQGFGQNQGQGQGQHQGTGASQNPGTIQQALASLPLDPQFEAVRRVLEDNLARSLSEVQVGQQQVGAQQGLQTARMNTNQGNDQQQLLESMAGRGTLNSSIYGDQTGLLATDYARQHQDLANSIASSYSGLSNQAGDAYATYNQGLAEALLASGQNSANDPNAVTPHLPTGKPPRKRGRRKGGK